MKFICKKCMVVYEIKLDDYADITNLKKYCSINKNNRIGG